MGDSAYNPPFRLQIESDSACTDDVSMSFTWTDWKLRRKKRKQQQKLLRKSPKVKVRRPKYPKKAKPMKNFKTKGGMRK